MGWFDNTRQEAGLAGGSSATGDWDSQLDAALRGSYGGYPVNEDFIRQQKDYFNQKRFSGELTGAGKPADDAYWLMRAKGAAVDDPASGHPQAGMGAANGGGLSNGFSLQGANYLSPFSAPGLLEPYTREFQRPDPNSIRNDPSYQFQVEEGLNDLQRSAANRGTLLTGATLKDITKYGQGLASTFDDKYWNRAFQIDNRDIGLYDRNVKNAYNMLSGQANMGQNAASSYAANVGGLYQQGANANAANTGAQNQTTQNTFGNLADLAITYAQSRQKPKVPVTTPPYSPGQALYQGDATRTTGAYA